MDLCYFLILQNMYCAVKYIWATCGPTKIQYVEVNMKYQYILVWQIMINIVSELYSVTLKSLRN